MLAKITALLNINGVGMITVYDTACGSRNLGDQIIMDAVIDILSDIFTPIPLVRYPTHYPLAKETLKQAWSNKLGFVAGTNLLRPNLRYRASQNKWALSFFDAWRMQPAILFGCGWNNYSNKTKPRSKMYYKRVLSSHFTHAVRDNYTRDKLIECGVENVVNTGCPTLWKLTPEHLQGLPAKKSKNVVFTLTDYRTNIEPDIFLVQTLKEHYESIYFWPQGSGDFEYLNNLAIDTSDIDVIKNTLSDFNQTLDMESIDYVGTRLHAGVRALQKQKRSIIIAIDNRATEMSKDFDLPVIERDDLAKSLKDRLYNYPQVSLNLPRDTINVWKSQFKVV